LLWEHQSLARNRSGNGAGLLRLKELLRVGSLQAHRERTGAELLLMKDLLRVRSLKARRERGCAEVLLRIGTLWALEEWYVQV
jgi:hypothetical protein